MTETVIAVTGHMDLTEDTVPLVRTALQDLLRSYALTRPTRRGLLHRGGL